jgi:hypothetical protein
MAMLMPREMKIESAHTVIGSLSDEQLHAMVHELQERIAAKLKDAKVINGEAVAALPAPSSPRVWRPKRKTKATADCETIL